MKLHSYGSYDDYMQAQIEANKRKIDWVWVHKESMKAIREYRDADNIICHGARNGAEIEFFREYFNGFVMGTDISPTADTYGLTQWDFNKQNSSWIGRFDIVYSNSLDHSPNPNETVEVWKEQCNEGGNVMIEWGKEHNKQHNAEIDPFMASLDEYREMFEPVNEIKTSYSTILVL